MASQRIQDAVTKFRNTKETKRAAGLAHRQSTQELIAALSDEGVQVNELLDEKFLSTKGVVIAKE